jgi:AraC family transcriptional regulator
MGSTSDSPPYQLWIDGRFTPPGSLKAGTSSIFDLRTSPYSLSVGNFRHVHFYLPRQTLNAIAETEGLGHISEISYAGGFSNADPVMKHIGKALENTFDVPERASRLFVDHVMTGVADHFLKVYGQLRFSRPQRQPGLSARQERRAKEILSANLDGEVSLCELAAASDMSIQRFRQAFQTTIGVPPHAWLRRYRIDRALALLQGSRMLLSEVALRCGFADEQHLADAFLKYLGNPLEAFRAVSPSRTYLRH